jgi:hypothetical protein
MKKNIFVYVMAGILSLVGIQDVSKAAILEFQNPITQTQQESEQRTTMEGTFELAPSSILFILARYLSVTRAQDFKFEPVFFRQKTKFIIAKRGATDEEITATFNENNTRFIYLVNYELEDKLSTAFNISDISFDLQGSFLYSAVSAKVLSFTGPKEQQQLVEGLKKNMEKLLEIKIDHIREESAASLNKKEGAKDFLSGKNIVQVITNCFKQEVIDAENGIKTLNIGKFFPTKWGGTK